MSDKPVSTLRRLALNASAYTVMNLLVTAGSIVSFPILTRLLSVDEYGLMGLVTSILGFLVSCAKVGVQGSAVRYYSRVAAGKSEFTFRQYYSTVLFGMALTGLGATLLWTALSPITPVSFWNDTRVHGLFLLTSCLVLVRVIESALVNILRAQQKARTQAAYSVIKRYAGLALVIGTLVFVSRSVHGFYYGTIVNEVLAVLGLWLFMQRQVRFSPREFSMPLFKQLLAFGVPLIGSELGSILLNVGDRYLLQAMLGAEEVGKYAAAYNMCEYVEVVVISSVGSALAPIYLRLYDEKGREATEEFLSRSLRYYFLVGIPLIVGLIAVGEEALILLASEKYREGAVVIPWVISGVFVSGLQSIAVAGLWISSRTRLIMALVLGAAGVNVLLNLWLIPKLGIEGAGIATLVSYCVVTAAMELYSRKLIRVRFPWLAILRFSAAALAMFFAVRAVGGGPRILNVLVKVAVGAAVYASLVIALDADSRGLAERALDKLLRRKRR